MKLYALSGKERLKSRNDFEKIFESGSTIYSDDKKIRAVYIIEEEGVWPFCKIGVAISKKAGIAAWRNRIKRLVKDSYRNNKEIILPICKEKGKMVKIIFMAGYLNENNNKKIIYNQIMPGVVNILSKIKAGIK